MEKAVWEFQHSVECDATRQHAWKYWADIANWDDPPARFHLDGPFAAGSRLTTVLPGQTLNSLIRDLKPEREATIEMQLHQATLSFHWKFEELSKERARITQRLTLDGPNAQSFVAQASVLEETVPDGMKKLAEAIQRSSCSEQVRAQGNLTWNSQ